MRTENIRYTATLPLSYLNELKDMARDKKIPSVNFAINEALDEYMQSRKAAQYESLMKEAGRDKAFLDRTTACMEDFGIVDGEVSVTW